MYNGNSKGDQLNLSGQKPSPNTISVLNANWFEIEDIQSAAAKANLVQANLNVVVFYCYFSSSPNVVVFCCYDLFVFFKGEPECGWAVANKRPLRPTSFFQGFTHFDQSHPHT